MKILSLTSGTLAALAMLAPTMRADTQGVVPTKTGGLVQLVRDAIVEAPYTGNVLRIRMMMAVYSEELMQVTRTCVADMDQYTQQTLRVMSAMDARGVPDAAIARVAAEGCARIEACATGGMRQLNAIGAECYELLELFGEPRWAMELYERTMAGFESMIWQTARRDMQRIEAAMGRMI